MPVSFSWDFESFTGKLVCAQSLILGLAFFLHGTIFNLRSGSIFVSLGKPVPARGIGGNAKRKIERATPQERSELKFEG